MKSPSDVYYYMNSWIAHLREAFRIAIKKDDASIILVHNHPSMNLTVSREDRAIADRLVEVDKLVGISVLDHIVVGQTYYSFKENELI